MLNLTLLIKGKDFYQICHEQKAMGSCTGSNVFGKKDRYIHGKSVSEVFVNMSWERTLIKLPSAKINFFSSRN